MNKLRLSIVFMAKAIGVLFSSWLIVHFASIFGIFVAIAYPFWWIIFPGYTPCLMCRAKQMSGGGYCLLCRQMVGRGVAISPKSIRSVLLNVILIGFFSLISFTLVIFEGYLIKNIIFNQPEKTVSFIFPSKGQYRLYEVFPMKVEVVGIKGAINAIQADIGFDPSILKVVDISTNGSFADIFVQKEIDNEHGFARISGGLPNPGYSGGSGLFATYFFEAIGAGVSKVDFLPSSMVLANDGKGTNVLKELSSASYLILPDEVPPEEREEQVKLIGRSDVLGVSGGDFVQLKFYDESEPHLSVLGESFDQEVSEKAASKSLFERPIRLISSVDRIIVSFWKNVLRSIGDLF